MGEEKYSDDGEPNGTAGLRIYNAINHFELNNVLVVVVRYFGGTKLGVGPLGKAYYNCALEVLDSSKKSNLLNLKKLKLNIIMKM
ncbi:MAG: YigZ family protein [Ignavibacteriales bacterium]|nr:YigZ family protein [Ignavibacteriales bacterium]